MISEYCLHYSSERCERVSLGNAPVAHKDITKMKPQGREVRGGSRVSLPTNENVGWAMETGTAAICAMKGNHGIPLNPEYIYPFNVDGIHCKHVV